MSALQKMSYTEELKLVDAPNGLTAIETLFCLHYCQGVLPNEAIQLATRGQGGNLSTTMQTRTARKILKKPAVKVYLQQLMKRLEDMAVADALEIQMFLTEAIRTPIDHIDGTSKLCQKKRVTVRREKGSGDEIEKTEYESVSKMEAVKTLIAMKGLNAPVKVDHRVAVGVMVVPMAANVDDWEKHAAVSQKALMEDATNI